MASACAWGHKAERNTQIFILVGARNKNEKSYEPFLVVFVCFSFALVYSLIMHHAHPILWLDPSDAGEYPTSTRRPARATAAAGAVRTSPSRPAKAAAARRAAR